MEQESKKPHSYPPEVFVKKASWGGFLMGPLWALGSRLYVLGLGLIVLAFVPVIGQISLLGVAIWLGVKGRQMAWKSGKWKDFEAFRKRQKLLDNIGFILLFVTVAIALFGANLFGR